MRTSARNQFSGIVTALKPGAVNYEVEVALNNDVRIVAVVTRESTESLGLKVGGQVFALIKASSIILARDLDGVRLSARNQLVGTVRTVNLGAVNAEVVLDLNGGGTIAAVVTNASAEALALAPGQPAIAIIKASSVILGALA